MATVRSRRVSRALYTSPIPPAPSGARISYGPRRVPIARGIRECPLLSSRLPPRHAQISTVELFGSAPLIPVGLPGLRRGGRGDRVGSDACFLWWSLERTGHADTEKIP